MTDISTPLATLTLLVSGNLELTFPQGAPLDDVPQEVLRLGAIELLWDIPEFLAMLDKTIQANKGEVPFQ